MSRSRLLDDVQAAHKLMVKPATRKLRRKVKRLRAKLAAKDEQLADKDLELAAKDAEINRLKRAGVGILFRLFAAEKKLTKRAA